MKCSFSLILLLILSNSLTVFSESDPDQWPAFLGQGASPLVPETIPLHWSPTENIAWNRKLPGKGQSSPVIFGSKVFVTSIAGTMKDKCFVSCLNLDDGSLLWEYSTEASQKVRSNYFQSRSTPTPIADAERVYAFFETGNLVALTHEGKPVWSRSLTEEYGEIESNIGLAASPIQIDGKIVILVDHEGPSYILAIDKSTGDVLWKTDRESRKSYASPALVPINEKLQIVCSSDGSIDGYDPDDGKQLWTFADVGGNVHATPLPYGNGRFLTGASPGMHNEREAMAKKSNFAMEVVKTENGFKPTILWKNEQTMPSFASPVTYRTESYWVNRAGVVFCFDSDSGKLNYSKRTKQVCWVTPFGLGDHVYLFGKDGTTTVLAAGPEFKIISENQLWDPEKVESDPFGRDRSGGGSRPDRGDRRNGQSETQRTSDSTEKVEQPEEIKLTAGKPDEKPDSGSSDTAESESNPSRRPRMSDAEREENRSRGENRFADPVQYGIAVVNGSLIIRTGDTVYCVREK